MTDGGKMNPVIDADGHVFETNYVYSVADRTEPIWVQCFRRFILLSLPGRKEVRFDWAKFTWIGAPQHNGSPEASLM